MDFSQAKRGSSKWKGGKKKIDSRIPKNKRRDVQMIRLRKIGYFVCLVRQYHRQTRKRFPCLKNDTKQQKVGPEECMGSRIMNTSVAIWRPVTILPPLPQLLETR
jgi:hypothetical protein